MNSFIDTLKSFRRWALGLNVANARIDEIYKKQDDLSASFNALPISDITAKLDDAHSQQSKLGVSLNELQKKLDAQEIFFAPDLKENEAIRIVLIAQHPSVWPSWRSVWDAASKNARFSVQVVLARFVHPFSSEATTYDDMKQCLISEGVPFCTEAYFQLKSFRPHVTFIQNPYEETRSDKFKIEQLEKSGTRIAYVPYGLEIGGGAWNLQAQFDTSLHRSAWRIFARSQRSKVMFGKYCSAGNAHVVVTGHPKLDAFQINSVNSLSAGLVEKIAGRKVILWTPHFSVGDLPTWSTFKTYGEFILSEISRRQDLFLLLRPHPLFFQAMRQHGLWDAQGERDFRRMINTADNLALDENPDYHAAFSIADALMADAGSFLLEFWPTGKPLLYLHCEGGLGINDDGDLVNHLYVGYNQTDIANFIDMVELGNDPRKRQRKEVLSDFLFGLDLESTAGERICNHIHTALSTEGAWSPRAEDTTIEQAKSEAYWMAASTTYLAPPDYYDHKNTLLSEVLSQMPKIDNAIDIGAGDGKFTFELAKYASNVTGYDISPTLIEKAKQTAANLNLRNVQFITQELEDLAPLDKYDLLSCMGVTSCITDDVKFLSILDKFKMLSKQGGILLLIDTLSNDQDQLCSDQSGYIVKYRSIDSYRTLVARRGFMLKTEILIKEAIEKGLVNKLFVFEFDPDHNLRA